MPTLSVHRRKAAASNSEIKEAVAASRPALFNTTTTPRIPPQPDEESFDELADVMRLTKQRRAQIYYLISQQKFPASIRLSAESKRVYWVHSEVVQWIRNHIEEWRNEANAAARKKSEFLRSENGTFGNRADDGAEEVLSP
jgi:predicted DNA-binding transcriptional regulator AlpA